MKITVKNEDEQPKKHKKQKKYRIHYYFDGIGYVDVEAENKEEAEDMFFDGNFSEENEWGENYNIENITEE